MAALYDSANLISAPIGVVAPLPSTGVPYGWALCDGSTFNKTVYALLFAAIGTIHGEPVLSGATFNIPDYRGRFLRGWADATGRDPDASSRTAMNANGLTGNNLGTLQTDAFQGHRHALYGRVSVISNSSTGQVLMNDGAQTTLLNSTAREATTDGSHGTPRLGTDTRPLNGTTNFIIRLF